MKVLILFIAIFIKIIKKVAIVILACSVEIETLNCNGKTL